MKATVQTDFWKHNLSVGDSVTDEDYSTDVLLRASESGYVLIEEEQWHGDGGEDEKQSD